MWIKFELFVCDLNEPAKRKIKLKWKWIVRQKESDVKRGEVKIKFVFDSYLPFSRSFQFSISSIQYSCAHSVLRQMNKIPIKQYMLTQHVSVHLRLNFDCTIVCRQLCLCVLAISIFRIRRKKQKQKHNTIQYTTCNNKSTRTRYIPPSFDSVAQTKTNHN